ncbi:hypothetical protein [Massilia yuzhufengensis]|uniref:Uncharacterized protein n=1 Tax=Massilia yuzhufengensis TaxID=1164594 RepID=A0A1I1QM39_9BURK|nr:hypothetical protein [Massilia yuzhufengensis]SFD23052.1 hypothetical protein SAMN05216204_11985 [Massilia yuzhufengensis]
MRHSCFIAAALCGLLAAGPLHAAQESGAPDKPAVPDYERIGRFIYAFHRTGANPEKLRDPLVARRAPPELATRAAELADKFDAIVKQRVTLPDDELKATLREAELVSAALWRWREGQAQQESAGWTVSPR